ncbi:toll/interleukin-1 receptor domain-containing protein [Leucothrix pacifica]|uniref:TIR domain-containing protein n=1 Tax=Leucothrix pacifica TaxID=1247513 RepID=A0A317C2H9_9GAMM|nr:toll/interleukin-1 receptor domain-containing protein [Leucothrix pacifica]PWQ92835.1 hypothetical protein DKW60_19010 [Leucothrix pacifica]
MFLDAWELTAGDNFTRKIFSAMKHSRCALLIATPEAAESGWVQEEYEYMFNLAKQREDFHWIPIVLGEFPDFPFLSNIQAVDFEDSSEEKYRTAFQKLLCGLDKQAPGAKPYFSGDLALPEMDTASPEQTSINAQHTFIKDVWDRLDASMPLMILAQADTNTQHYIQALKQSLQQGYPNATFLHLFPPASVRVDSAAYFGRLAKQCGLDEGVSESWEWADALREKLDQGEEFVLLITGFENGAEDTRGELAGELRGLLSNYPYSLKLIVMGSEQLAAAKYKLGKHSFFNDLDEMRLPDVSLQDLKDIYLKRYADLSLDDDTLESLLTFTGKHPRLLESALQCLKRGDPDWQANIKNSALPSQLFTRFRNETDAQLLCDLLQKQILGRYDAWPQDTLIRRLYWQNLITDCDGKFVWRCGFVQQTGLELLQC